MELLDCFKVVAVTLESGGSVVKYTSAVQEILIMGKIGRNRKRSTRAMARDKFPIGELARRRRLLKEEYVENCRVYSDERENLSRLKRKVLSHRVCARRPCWRSKTRKLFSFGKKFNCHAKIFLLFTPPTWPPCTDPIAKLQYTGKWCP